MRRAQIAIFLLVGVVLLITVVILIFAALAVRPDDPTPDVPVDESLARTCLSRTTQQAIQSLSTDGLILMNESGPVPVLRPDDTPYLMVYYIPLGEQSPPSTADQLASIPPRQPLGDYAYVGLCDPDPAAPNGLNRVGNRRFTCDNLVYNYLDKDPHGRSIPSVQEQLQTSISLQMQECLGKAGNAEVIIQNSGILVRWDDPDIEYSPSVPLHLAFRAIQYVVTQEVSRVDFSPNRMVDGDYPDRNLECEDCEFVDFYPDPDKELEEPGIDWYVIDVAGNVVIRFGIDDRNISRPRPDGSITERLEHNVICAGPGNDYVACSTDIEALTVDDDLLTLNYHLPENAQYLNWYEGMQSQTCRYPGTPKTISCVPTMPTIEKLSGDDWAMPHRNNISVKRGCLQPPQDLVVELSDGDEAVTKYAIQFTRADPHEVGGVEVNCECVTC